jgi:two-component system cell cycle response regulator DivK
MDQQKILYIEDNFHNRRIVRKILDAYGYQVWEAEDGPTGLEIMDLEMPAVVLLDIGLQEMDGLQVLARIKADDRLNHIPVIALTASAMSGDRERFLQAGCDDYLSKPIQVLELVRMVAQYCPPANPNPLLSGHLSDTPRLGE